MTPMMQVLQNEGITYRRWRADEPKCALLLVHGLGAHGGRWEAFADYFLKRSISSYAIEPVSYTHLTLPTIYSV